MALQSITLTNIVSIQTIHRKKDLHTQIVDRASHGLSFCLEGRLTYRHRGKEFISEPGTAIFLPKGASYSIATDKAGIFPLINFDCEEPISDTLLVVQIQNREEYLAAFEAMKRRLLLPNSRLRLLELFYGILARLAEECHPQQSTLAPAIEYLQSNLHDPSLSVASLADLLGYSQVYVRKLFAATYGCSPHRYILQMRLQRARQLLADGILSVGGVAEQCGFSSVYHFSRAFKQLAGCSPSEYSRQNRVNKL